MSLRLSKVWAIAMAFRGKYRDRDILARLSNNIKFSIFISRSIYHRRPIAAAHFLRWKIIVCCCCARARTARQSLQFVRMKYAWNVTSIHVKKNRKRFAKGWRDIFSLPQHNTVCRETFLWCFCAVWPPQIWRISRSGESREESQMKLFQACLMCCDTFLSLPLARLMMLWSKSIIYKQNSYLSSQR